MAIIPAEEKVFMVSNSTNTIYSGSAALKAMQQWYTMQDVADSVANLGAPTLQRVTTAGNTTNQTIRITDYSGAEGLKIDVVDSQGIYIPVNGLGSGIVVECNGDGSAISGTVNGIGTAIAGVNDADGHGVSGQSQSGIGVLGQSTDNHGVYGVSDVGFGVYGQSNDSIGVYGASGESFGGYFTSSGSSALYAGSNNGTAITGISSEADAGVFSSQLGAGINASSSSNVGGYFSSTSNYSIIAAQSAAKPGGGAWSVYSDSRLKENVVPYTKGLSDILLINPVTYEYNGLAGTTKGKKYTGIIAQEIKEVFPDTVNTYKAKLNEEDEEKTELYDFNASDLTFALINAIKELKAEIDLLKSK